VISTAILSSQNLTDRLFHHNLPVPTVERMEDLEVLLSRFSIRKFCEGKKILIRAFPLLRKRKVEA
jgi:hypothetical protein